MHKNKFNVVFTNEKHVDRELELLEQSQSYSLQELEDIMFFTKAKLELDASMTAELATAASETIIGRTRGSGLMNLNVQGVFVCGTINEVKFYAFETGARRIVIIKDYDESEEPVAIAFSYEGCDGGRIKLTPELQAEAEYMLSTLGS